jgi:hypothetical protein
VETAAFTFYVLMAVGIVLFVIGITGTIIDYVDRKVYTDMDRFDLAEPRRIRPLIRRHNARRWKV